ncbi:MAG: hypothetical protein OEY59_03410 [Deltaproteobacteria bacterium]|nr:hypothetical protein [Deltaproteobacteria bacterium]
MPELPEVETIVRELNQRVIGKKIRSLLINRDLVIKGDGGEFKKKLTGQSISAVKRMGKYLVFRLKEDLFLLAHLRMTGKFVFQTSMSDPKPHDRLIFFLSAARC